MTDHNKAVKLPDDFLRLFNYQQGQIPIGGTSSGVPIPQQYIPEVPQTPQGVPQTPGQQAAPTPLLPDQINVPVPIHPSNLPPPLPVQPPHQIVPPDPVQRPVPQPSPVTPQIPAQASNVSGDAAGQVILHQNAALRAQVAQYEADHTAQAIQDEQARIQALPKQDQVLAQLDILKTQNQTAIVRAQEWRIEAEKREIINQYGGELDSSKLDTTSLQTLHASIPPAQESYRLLESQMFSKFRSQMGLHDQATVEGLPPSPGGAVGFPSSNRAGAVPSLPTQAVSNPMVHPQLSRDNAYNYTQTSPGRVFQPQNLPTPQPQPNGQYFTPTYPQQGAYPPTLIPQVPVMQPPVIPSNPAEYQIAVQQAQLAAQQQGMMPPQAMVAPTPDPNTRADGSSPGRNLQPYESGAAVEAARQSIAASRRAGMSGMAAVGLREHPTVAAAMNSYGPQIQQNLPIPTGYERATAHPQYLAGARV